MKPLDGDYWDTITKEGLTVGDTPSWSTWLGSELMHVYFAYGRKTPHVAQRIIVHYGDDELEISNEQIWRVLNELFGGDDNA